MYDRSQSWLKLVDLAGIGTVFSRPYSSYKVKHCVDDEQISQLDRLVWRHR